MKKSLIIGTGLLITAGIAVLIGNSKKKEENKDKESGEIKRKWYVDDKGNILNEKEKNNVYSTPREKFLDDIRDLNFFRMLRKPWVNRESYCESIFKAGSMLGKAEKKRKKKEPVGFTIELSNIGTETFLFDSEADLKRFKALCGLEGGIPEVETAEILYRIDLYTHGQKN